MSICRNLPRHEFGTKWGGGCDVSFFQAAGNMGVMTWQLGRVLFCIAYKVVHQPFFGLKISSQVLTAFAIHYHKERTCPADGSSLNHFDFVYITLCISAPHGGGIFKLGSNNGFISSFANSRVFCFYVMFNETQWLICIWGNSVNVGIKIHVGG